MSAARPIAVADNDQVRVTTWMLDKDSAATGQHHHDFDYMSGQSPAECSRSQTPTEPCTSSSRSRARPSPLGRSTHDVVNSSGCEAVFVEIELK